MKSKQNTLAKLALAGMAALAPACLTSSSNEKTIEQYIAERNATAQVQPVEDSSQNYTLASFTDETQEHEQKFLHPEEKEKIKNGFDPRFRIAVEHGRNKYADQAIETVEINGKEFERKVTNRTQDNSSRLTLGFGKTQDKAWNSENARIYVDRFEDSDGIEHVSVRAGYRDSFTLGGVDSEVLGFFQAGDDGEGVGLQTTHQFGRVGGAFNLERMFADEELGVEERTLVGFDLDVQVTDALNLGIAYDTVKDSTGRDNYTQARVLIDLTPNDLIGFSYINMDEHDVETHRGIASWTRYGKDKNGEGIPWGGQVWARLDHTQETETTSFFLDSWFGQNPNVGRYHGIVPHSRRRGDIPSHREVVDNALDFEVPPFPLYTNGGWSFGGNVSYTSSPDSELGKVSGSVAHKWGLTDSASVYVRPYVEGFFGDQSGWGAGLDTAICGDDLFLMLKLTTQSVDDRDGLNHRDTGVFVYLGWSPSNK